MQRKLKSLTVDALNTINIESNIEYNKYSTINRNAPLIKNIPVMPVKFIAVKG